MVTLASLMALSQLLHRSMKLARDSGGLILRCSISDDTSTFAPSLGIVQDKTWSRIARPQTSLHVSVAILDYERNLPLMKAFNFVPLMK